MFTRTNVFVCRFVRICLGMFGYFVYSLLWYNDTLDFVCLLVCILYLCVCATVIKLRNIKPIKITFKIVYFSCTPRICGKHCSRFFFVTLPNNHRTHSYFKSLLLNMAVKVIIIIISDLQFPFSFAHCGSEVHKFIFLFCCEF